MVRFHGFCVTGGTKGAGESSPRLRGGQVGLQLPAEGGRTRDGRRRPKPSAVARGGRTALLGVGRGGRDAARLSRR